jgi:hypothetical protein
MNLMEHYRMYICVRKHVRILHYFYFICYVINFLINVHMFINIPKFNTATF